MAYSNAGIQHPIWDKGGAVYNVKAFGAVGDGVADDTAALLALAEAAGEGEVATLPPGVYRTTAKVAFAGGLDCHAEATILADHAGVALEVRAEAGGTARNQRRRYRLPRVDRNVGLWKDPVNAAGTGIRLVNLFSSEIHVPFVQGFEYGLQCVGDGAGFAYNTVIIGQLSHNRVNLDLDPDAGVGGGWTNQNTFIGGRYSWFSDGGGQRENTHHAILRGNTNCFVNPSWEGGVGKYQVLFDGAAWHLILSPRFEVGSGDGSIPFIRFQTRAGGGGHSIGNMIVHGYNMLKLVIEREDTNQSRNGVLSHARWVQDLSNSSAGMVLAHVNGNSTPILALMTAGEALTDDPATQYLVQLAANFYKAKQRSDVEPRLWFDHTTGFVYFGTGAVAPVARMRAEGAAGDQVRLYESHFHFGADNTHDIGMIAALRPRRIHVGTAVRIAGGSNLSGYLATNVSLDFPSIAAGATAELTVALTGVTEDGNWAVAVSPRNGFNAGLVWCGYVSAADTVTVRVANVTGSAIDPAARNFAVQAFRRA